LKIDIDFAAEAATKNANRLSSTVADQIAAAHPQIKHLEVRLRQMQLFPLGKIVPMKSDTTPHDNAVALIEQEGGTLYVGYRIYRDDFKRFHCDVHSFCVKNGRVLDSSYRESGDRYVGMEVPVTDIHDLRYLSMFDRDSYIDQNAPFALL
jgi:hypothetical protein